MSALARRQHGVVARCQLIEAGPSSATIGRMLASGWLVRVHAGVYAPAAQPLSLKGRWMAAALAGGERALVSHRSAGELWGLLEPIHGPVHVTAAGGHSRDGLVFHRANDPAARVLRERIPVTGVERTLLDLAGCIHYGALRRALEEGDRLALLDHRALTLLCERTSGRRGAGRLRALIRDHRPLTHTRSELERQLLRLCRGEGISAPATNVPVEGFVVDCLWPGARLVVELDGYAFHRSRASFERDRARDAALQLAGYRVVRITSRMLAEQPPSVPETLRGLLKALAVS